MPALGDTLRKLEGHIGFVEANLEWIVDACTGSERHLQLSKRSIIDCFPAGSPSDKCWRAIHTLLEARLAIPARTSALGWKRQWSDLAWVLAVTRSPRRALLPGQAQQIALCRERVYSTMGWMEKDLRSLRVDADPAVMALADVARVLGTDVAVPAFRPADPKATGSWELQNVINLCTMDKLEALGYPDLARIIYTVATVAISWRVSHGEAGSSSQPLLLYFREVWTRHNPHEWRKLQVVVRQADPAIFQHIPRPSLALAAEKAKATVAAYQRR